MNCYNWNPQRCTAHADYWLIQPDGRRNPGGWICAAHGHAVVKEYAEKLGEQWVLEPIDEFGHALKSSAVTA